MVDQKREAQLRDAIEHFYFAYRAFTAKPDRILEQRGLGRVHHRILYFVGRKDDIIKSRGEKVSPRELENVLHGLEGVAEAAVIGVPDALMGQAIKAVLVLKEGATVTEADVLRHCRQRVEDFAMPKHVEFRTSMPRTSTGKINKREL